MPDGVPAGGTSRRSRRFLGQLAPEENRILTAGVSEGRSVGAGRLAGAVFMLDSWLRRWHQVYEFTADPRCIFRLQRMSATSRLRFPDGALVEPGDPILNLHVWNEHVPPIGPGGPTLAWARRTRTMVDHSLRLLCQHIDENAGKYDGIAVIRADITFGSAERSDQLARIAATFCFRPMREELSGASRLRRVGDNILMLLLVAAANPAAARWSVLRRDHAITYLQRRQLDQQYGARALADVDG